jgi:hypothetical protein
MPRHFNLDSNCFFLLRRQDHTWNSSAEDPEAGMAAPLYARFVPPKSRKPRDSIANQNGSPAPAGGDQLYVRYIPPKASKQVKSATESIDSQPVSSTEKVAQKEKKKEEKEQRKSKKPKKRKLQDIQDAELDPDSEANDTYNKRHQLIFSKFQRSSKIAEHVRDRQTSPIERAMEKEPTPELHGGDSNALTQLTTSF